MSRGWELGRSAGSLLFSLTTVNLPTKGNSAESWVVSSGGQGSVERNAQAGSKVHLVGQEISDK